MDAINSEESATVEEEQMMLQIFNKFDVDGDRILNLEEFNSLQLSTEGKDAQYNQEQLTSLLLSVNDDLQKPELGMPFEEYRKLYADSRLRRMYSTDVTRDFKKIFGEDAKIDMSEAMWRVNGSPVVITGLKSAADLNGREGRIVPAQEAEREMVNEGRVVVELTDGERVALRPENVSPLKEAKEAKEVKEVKSVD